MSFGFGSLLGFALICAASSLILKNFGWKGAPVFVCVCIVGVFSLFSGFFSKIGGSVGEIVKAADIGEYAEAVLKIIGIGYLYTIGSDLCTELGEVGLAKAVTVGGRLEIILISLPYFSEILDAAVSLFE